MCLYSKQEKPFIAKEDILTYKLLLKNERGEYFTPYFGKVVKLGETLYGGDIDVEYNSESNGLFNEIGNGYVHSYVNPFGEWNTGYEILWLYDFRFDYRDCTCVLVKCIIPKGTHAPGKVCPMPSVPIIGLTFSIWATAVVTYATTAANQQIFFLFI